MADIKTRLPLEVEMHSCSFNKLPDNILLEIFRYITCNQLCRIARVCRKWNRVIKDQTLWRHIDLTVLGKLTLKHMWNIVRTRCSVGLVSLHLLGEFCAERQNLLRKPLVSDALMAELKKRSPNIRELHLTNTNISGLSASYLPACLTHLRVRHCNMPTRWLKHAIERGLFQHLISLDLSQSYRLTKLDIMDICELTQLKHLNVNGCYRLKNEDFASFCKSLSLLESLEVRDLVILPPFLQQIGPCMKHLKKLDLGGQFCVVNKSLKSIFSSGFSELEDLCLSGCSLYSADCLTSIKHLPRLRRLDISNTNLDPSQVSQVLPNINICVV